MAKIGYHISHEQFSPRELLRLALKAEQAGFDFCLSSDHFAPWSKSQGQSGFAWSWLGSALAMTKRMDFGIVNCPAYRYHPAIIAQASATLDQMFPGRFWLTVGSGQALNEAITGAYWPTKNERNIKLKAAVEIIRGLWKGETITSDVPIRVTNARLYTLPETEMKITGAAISPETARWMAPWADSLITISQPKEKLEKVLDAWRNYGGDQKPVKIKVQVSYDKTYNDALNGAWDQWRTNVFASSVQSELRDPLQFENAAEHVKPDEVSKLVFVSDNTNQHIEWLSSIVEMGFAEIDLHNVNRNQERFIDDFGTKVIPELIKITNTVGR
jgi:probable non-F420 flavinoid oxidoreductase